MPQLSLCFFPNAMYDFHYSFQNFQSTLLKVCLVLMCKILYCIDCLKNRRYFQIFWDQMYIRKIIIKCYGLFVTN
uniref:Uncharacterized protein n=1 Tax=Rhizophora mucronata TaxID=61149 RepID=A0A2P2Q6R3_RHIMU